MKVTQTGAVPAKPHGPWGSGGLRLRYRSATRALTLQQGLCLDLPYDEGAGANVHDDSPNGYDMIVVGAVWDTLPSGQFILTFNGLNNYLHRAYSQNLDFTSQAFTILCWSHGRVTASDMVLTQGRVNVGGYEFYLTETVNTISLRTNQAGVHTGISAIGYYTPAVWQLIGVTREGAGGQFYVNGLPVPTTLGTGLANAVSSIGHEFLIGVGEMGNYLRDDLSRTKIWSRALGAQEIKAVFDSERSLFGV